MRIISLIIFLAFINMFSYAQNDSVEARLVLIGDAGNFEKGKHPVLNAVKQTVPIDKKTTVLYLGDNLYSTGLPDEEYAYYNMRRTVLDSQIAIANGTDANVYFIPGNHDWDRGGKGGWEAILRQQRYIDNQSNKRVQFYPKDGCPGPVEIELTKDVVLVLFDSQWWIHAFDKPGVESDCEYKTKLQVLDHIEDILQKNMKKLVLIACHHPFRSYGIHGGYFTLKQHIFPFTDLKPNLYIPLPLIGSIYPIARGVFGVPEDLSHPNYSNMIRDVEAVASIHPNVVFLAGHEHNLQFIKDSLFTYVVSGSGTKRTRVSNNINAPFTSDQNGFAVINLLKNRQARINFYTVSDSVKMAYTENFIDYSRRPPLKLEDTIPVVYVPFSADSITHAANKHYAHASTFLRFFNGDNYRKVWSQPVQLKVFRVNETMGGFKVGQLGGGHQTRSLRLTDKDGAEWTLRTINKDISAVLPEGVRRSAYEKLAQDIVSTAHPYSPLAVPTLAKAADVIVAEPKFYFVPNDPALGFYRPFFANTVCMLEKREPTPKGEDTKSTQKLINKLFEDNDHRVNQQAFLKARLLDLLIADWDRHMDQWRWIEFDTGKGKLYHPIPRDRDQAFTYSDGFVIKKASKNLVPFLRGFTPKVNDLKWLAYWARDLDRFFLNRLDSTVWHNEVNKFVTNVNEEVIKKALTNMPPEIYSLSGKKLEDKLKSRRSNFFPEAMEYYRFLSKKVDIVGSNKHEYFKVESVGDNLQVRVYKTTKKTDSASIMYNRIFLPRETEEINLYGLNGEDIFEVDENAKSKIKVRMIGGRGDDTFNIKGKVKTYLYDLKSENNVVASARRTHNRFASTPEVHRYSPYGFEYDRYSFPNINLGYNVEDGIMAGVGLTFKTHGFRKEPYATFQKLSTLYAFSSGAYRVRYQGEFNQSIGGLDLLVNGELGKPVLNNFFGIGNNTTFEAGNRRYYRVRYNFAYGEALLRKRLVGIISLVGGAQAYNYWNHFEDNRDKILSNPSLVGLDSANVYKTKTYAGGKLGILLNNVNSNLLPTRGVEWNTNFSAMAGVNRNSRPVTTLTSDMTVYSSLTAPPRLVSVLKLGGGHIFSKSYEYFQALNVGQNNFLRGFRKNRFSGRSLAYGSLTLLYKVTESKSPIFPGPIGIIGFTDVARVWADGQSSERWHNSVGGGLYYAPFNMVLVSATVGRSREETLFNLTVGTKLNLTF